MAPLDIPLQLGHKIMLDSKIDCQTRIKTVIIYIRAVERFIVDIGLDNLESPFAFCLQECLYTHTC